uniref:Putative cell division control protein n=1 Tax=Trypanosoma congolense (strain IL3000) TaxID=1068625 RepID=G0UKE9_TRYCI|nr:putative cell division control protein [Trypanosoma congolense IL3000]
MVSEAKKGSGGEEKVYNYLFNLEKDLIGSGVYGEVFRATVVDRRDAVLLVLDEEDWYSDGSEDNVVAIKRIRCGERDGLCSSVLREVMVLQEVSKAIKSNGDAERCGENLVQLRNVVFDKGCIYLVTEFCDGGDLKKFMNTQRHRRLENPQQYRQMVRDILCGICFLHGREIAHRDLKPQNILLKSKRKPPTGSQADTATDCTQEDGISSLPYVLKIGDFGLSRMEGIPVKKYQHEAVSLWYRSPDVLMANTNYRYTADMWSFGCIMAEVATGDTLFRGRNELSQLKHIFRRLGPPSAQIFPSMNRYSLYEEFSPTLNKYFELLRRTYGSINNSSMFDMAKESLFKYFERYGVLSVVGDVGLDLLARLLAYEPKDRLTAEEALQHPFFTSMKRPVAASVSSEVGSPRQAEEGTDTAP